MICVSIGRGRHRMMIAEHRHLVEQGAGLVELRLDYIRSAVNLQRLLKDRFCPVIATCRREQDGGRWTGTEEARQMLLRSAIAEGVDYVDLEEDVAGGIPRFGKTKRIVSYHNFRETPEDLHQLHARLAALDADVVKIATMAHHPHDSVRMLRVIRDADVASVGMCMGDIGTPSRILAGKFGAPFTYATFHHERALAPGQLSYAQMTRIYNYEGVRNDTEVYGVVADPVGHSLSPIVHNKAFQGLKQNKVYVPFRVPREDLAQFLKDCPELGVRGLSVTIPHKEAVVPYLTSVDAAAGGIGAVNTIIFRHGELTGYNTDHQAAMDSLTSLAGQDTLTGRAALVLGAGGVSRAIAYGLKQRQADVVISGRTADRARDLAASLECQHVDWDDRYSVRPHVLVNGTPVGMHPNVDDSPFDGKHLRRPMIVFDTVYNPEQTLLIKEARKAGCRIATGVDMFVRQAALQFKLFTGSTAPVDLMREVVKRAIGPARYAD